MLNVENARPTAQTLLNHIERFESFCNGIEKISPEKFRKLNEELSIGAVFMLGSRRYERTRKGRRLLWRAPDEQEYDLGLTRDAKVIRDYPGYNAKSSISLSAGKIIETHVIPTPRGKGTLLKITLEDGTTSIAPNYRMALRNAVLKRHLNTEFNKMSLIKFWQRIWGHA